MRKTLLMDEFHISIFAPRGLTEPENGAIYGTLKLARFRRELRRAVVSVIRRYGALKKMRVWISR